MLDSHCFLFDLVDLTVEMIGLLSWPRDDLDWLSVKKNKEAKAPFILHNNHQGAPDGLVHMVYLYVQYILAHEKQFKKLKPKYFQPLKKLVPLLERYFTLRRYEELLALYSDTSFFWYRYVIFCFALLHLVASPPAFLC